MTKEEYWELLSNKNISFKKETVKITTRSLKAIVFQAFEKGTQNAVKCNKNDLKKRCYCIFSGIFCKKYY